jgi:hypothetical protein
MRPDQIERLQDLAEQIGEVFLEEADPQNWNGAGLPLVSLNKETRGGRYWDKKNAIQTGTLLARVLDLRDRDTRSLDTKTPEEDAEQEITRFEKQAKDMVNAVIARATSKG